MNGVTKEELSKVMSALGSRGGKSTSPAKKRASRVNIARATKARMSKRKKPR